MVESLIIEVAWTSRIQRKAFINKYLYRLAASAIRRTVGFFLLFYDS
jgi:hypothetical protein